MHGTNPARAALSCAAAVVAAAVFGAAILPGAGPARAQRPQAEQRAEPHARIVVTGDGSVRVPPDYAQIRGGVTTRGKTAKEATDANSKLMAAIVAALQNSGIEQKDIQTAEFSIAPVYEQPQPNSEAKLSGFRVSNQVDVKIRQIDKLGDVLDRLIAAGATERRQRRIQAVRRVKGARPGASGRGCRRPAQGGDLRARRWRQSWPHRVDHGAIRLRAARSDDGDARGGRDGGGADLKRRGYLARTRHPRLRHCALATINSI